MGSKNSGIAITGDSALKTRILMITYNRPTYTDLSLKTLCENIPDTARIVIWDNASGDETRSIIKKYETHSRVEKVIFNSTNDRLRKPTNWFFDNYRNVDFLSKVDDDCLVPARWCEILQQAHLDIPEAGVLGCWRFFPEDFLEETARRKIVRFGAHQVMRNCWVEGSGYLMKRSVLDRIGLIREGESFTDYCLRASAKGFINGWYYPFLFQEHMDDPRAEHTGIRTEEDFQRMIPLSARTFKVDSKEAWVQLQRELAERLQAISYDPNDFIGLRASIRRRLCQFLGRGYLPLIKNGRQTAGV